MIKQALRIISLVILASFSLASIAFADVPDPYGRTGRRPIPPVPAENQYWIPNWTSHSSYGEGKCAIVLTFKAPQGSEVQYELKDDTGNLITKGIEKSENGRGEITLILDKPPVDKSCTLHFESACYLTMVKTNFGMKKTDNPTYIASWKNSYILKGMSNGYTEIEAIE